MRQDGLNGIEAAAEVYIKDALPCLRLNILKLLLLCDAGVIDEQRDMPQLVPVRATISRTASASATSACCQMAFAPLALSSSASASALSVRSTQFMHTA